MNEDYKKNLVYTVQDKGKVIGTLPVAPGQTKPRYEAGKYIEFPYNEYMQYLKVHSALVNTKQNCYIATRTVNGRWIPVIDCDKSFLEDSIIRAAKNRFSKFVLFRSSQTERYWIFIDSLGTLDEAYALMELGYAIPEAYLDIQDSVYVTVMKMSKTIVVRGYPKSLQIPTEIYRTDHCSKEFTDWIEDFKNYWYSDDMGEILGNQFLETV